MDYPQHARKDDERPPQGIHNRSRAGKWLGALKMDRFYTKAATLAYENAVSLNKEARLLFDCGHFPRSVALAISSIEEQVKAYTLLLVAMGKLKPESLSWQEGAKVKYLLRDHKLKDLLFGAMFRSKFLLEELIEMLKAGKIPEGADDFYRSLHGTEEMDKAFKKMEKTRQNAIYVGVGRQEPIKVPSETFNREKAETFLGWSSELLGIWEAVFKNPAYWLPILTELAVNEGNQKPRSQPPQSS